MSSFTLLEPSRRGRRTPSPARRRTSCLDAVDGGAEVLADRQQLVVQRLVVVDVLVLLALAAGGERHREGEQGERGGESQRASRRETLHDRCGLIAEMSHRALTLRLAAGRRAAARVTAEAWNELVERFSRYVYAIAQRGFQLSGADAEDVFQEVFARTYERLGRPARRRGAAALARPDHAAAEHRRAAARRARAGRPSRSPSRSTTRGSPGSTRRCRCTRRWTSCPTTARRCSTGSSAATRATARSAPTLDIPAGTIASRISRCLARMRELLGKETGPEAVR